MQTFTLSADFGHASFIYQRLVPVPMNGQLPLKLCKVAKVKNLQTSSFFTSCIATWFCFYILLRCFFWSLSSGNFLYYLNKSGRKNRICASSRSTWGPQRYVSILMVCWPTQNQIQQIIWVGRSTTWWPNRYVSRLTLCLSWDFFVTTTDITRYWGKRRRYQMVS